MKLKPCPFCGEREKLTVTHYNVYRAITCGNCQASGPLKHTSEKAKESWNKITELTACVIEVLENEVWDIGPDWGKITRVALERLTQLVSHIPEKEDRNAETE